MEDIQRSGDNVAETPEARIERLGRERPDTFRSKWAEVGFCFSVAMSQALAIFRGIETLSPSSSEESDR
ncbi:hypothetical protein LTR60_003835 [Cryomyces antarcticus]|nr:hypothetical protein LTR60_003835 [Cryomyces antarcticus]